jgi:hypothetical protein
MIKYAKIINQETGLCEVGLGTNTSFYQSIGMKQLNVQQSDIDNAWYLVGKCPMKTDEEKELEEKERVAKLNLTGADVERGIYQATGMDFDDVIALVEYLSKGELDLETGEVINKGIDIDIKALKIELKANHFYRGNPYVNAVGALLGFTSEQLDKFFETNDYTVLLPLVIEPEEPVDDGVTEYDIPEEVEDENTTDASI